jgi:DNA-directed RNA polymerase specialized sigma24 family protein
VSADESVRLAWLAHNILPLEGELRHWLARRIRGLARADIDDIIQESYARLLAAQLPQIVDSRAFFYTVAKNIVLAHVRTARPMPALQHHGSN